MAESLLAKLEQIEAKENGTAQPLRARRDELEERRVVRDRVLAPVRRHLSRRRAKPQLNVRVSW